MRTRLPPHTSNPPNVIQFTHWHDGFPNTSYNGKVPNFNPLIKTLITPGWQVNALVTITTSVRGAMHEQTIKDSKKLNTPRNEIKILMKQIT